MRPCFSTTTTVLLVLLVLGTPVRSFGRSLDGLVPFNRELFELGHRIFLANGNLADALRLAEAALVSRPEDVTWRRRAARIAEWRGEVYKAQAYWFHLATIDEDREARLHALRLAEAVGDLPGQKILLQQSLLSGADPQTLASYIRVCQILGETEEAIAMLEASREGAQRSFALAKLPELYEAAGKPHQAIRALTVAARQAPDMETLLRLARLQFSQGDPQGAYLSLKAAQSSPAAAEPAFQEALSDLCWMLQDIECAAAASNRLLGQGAGREEDSRRVFLAAWKSDPQQAFAAAIEGWRRFGKLDFLTMAAETGPDRGGWQQLEGELRGMTASQQARYESSSAYWLLRSRVELRLDRDAAALADYRKVLQLEPGDQRLAADYLGLLLELDRRDQLQTIAVRWLERSGAPLLADTMGTVYADLGDYPKALWLARSRLDAHRDDPAWLAGYAHLLEQNGRAEAATQARMQGLAAVENRRRQRPPDAPQPLQELETAAALRLQTEAGDRLEGTMRQLTQQDKGGQARDLITAWALAPGRHDAARLWLRRSLGPNPRLPDGVQLQLALAQNDLPQVAALLEGRWQRLPYRDAVEGARRTGALPLSEELAWQRSWQNPDDPLLFGQLQEIFGQRSGRIGYRLRLLDRDGVGGVENRFDAVFPLTKRFNFLAELSQTHNDPLETGVIGELPARDQLARLGLSARLEAGKASLSAGWRSAVEDFAFFEGALWYQLSRRLTLGGELLYSAPAEETVALALGGVKDQAALTLVFNATARDAAQLRLTRVALRDQSRRRLGEGGTCTLDLSHQLSFAYPDYAVRLFGGYYDYWPRGAPRGKTLTLLPGGFAGGTEFFVPDSYAQIGAGFSYGLGFRDRYSQSWKPFGRAELFWRSQTESGFSYELGLHGPVFGYDALSISLLQESGAFNTSGLSTRVQLGYGYFLN